MTPTDLLELLRAAISLGSLLLNLGYRSDPRGGAQAVADRIDPPHREWLTSASGARLLDVLVIDEGLLHDLMEEVDRAQAAYRRALRAATTPEARRQADRQAEQAICEHLQRIRLRNGGVLPLAELEDVWRSYACAVRTEPSARALAT